MPEQQQTHGGSPKFQIVVTPLALAAINAVTDSSSCLVLPHWASQDGRYREYRIEIMIYQQVPSLENASDIMDDKPGLRICALQMRFSGFYRRFACNDCFRRLPESYSTFPPRSLFWEDFTTNEANVQRRAKLMQHYLDQIWNHHPHVMVWSSKSMQVALDISEETHVFLCQLAETEQEKQRQMAQERQEQIAQEQRRVIAEKRERWEAAQNLEVPEDATTTSLRPTLVYKTALSFRLGVPFCNGQSGTIGIREDGTLWFELRRTDYPQLVPGANVTNHLTTARGRRSILVVRELFRIMDYKCEIFYMNSDGNYHRPNLTVHRDFQFGLGREVYRIKSRPNQTITCNGSCGHLRVFVDGCCAATLGSDLLSTCYTLKIGAGHDILLVMGIVSAMVRIQAHIRQTRRNNTALMMA